MDTLMPEKVKPLMRTASPLSQDTRWADGLRGIAAFIVVTSHITRALWPILSSPAMSETSPPTLLQLPYLRILTWGRVAVAVFAVLIGYVNALKTTKQTRAGNLEVALIGIAKSCFRRIGRFVLPAMIVTLLSWLACQLGAYKLATSVDSNWLRDSSPRPSPSFGVALYDLMNYSLKCWTDGGNAYDKTQWTLTYLLKGSLVVYLTLFATAYVKPKMRLLLYAAMYCFYWRCGDALIGINIFAGLAMAEFTFDPDVQSSMASHGTTYATISSLAIIVGLFVASYPEDHPEWAPWSASMFHFGKYIVPRGGELARFYPALGTNLFLTGILFNSTAKRILSYPTFTWMGKVSYAVYLTHAPLVRIVLTWLLYGTSKNPPPKVEDGKTVFGGWKPLPNKWLPILMIPLFLVLLYKLAHWWTIYIEPMCDKATKWIEQKFFREEDNSNNLMS